MRSVGWAVLGVLALGLAMGCDRGPAPPPIVLLTVDTLRADRLGAYGSDLDLTPELDRLAAGSLRFERAYAPASFTVPSLSAVLTGRHPEQSGITTNEAGLPRTVPTLAELLAAAGYRTGAVVSNYVLRPGTGLERGFERYDARFPQLEATRRLPERTAADTTDAALELLAELDPTPGRGAPFLLWVHYQDPHGPYTPPEGVSAARIAAERSALGGARPLPLATDHRGLGGIPTYQRIDPHRDAAWYRAAYDGEVAHTDAEIGRLLAALAARGLRERAIVLFLADHGEGLGEQDYWFAHGEYLSDPLVRVPLLLRVPGRAPERRGDVVALLDVLPTLLAQAGVAPPAGAEGRDLLGAAGSSAPYLATLGGSSVPRVALVQGGYKYTATLRGGDVRERLFLLGDEETDLSAQRPAELARLRAALGAERERLRATAPVPGRGRVVGEREREHLRRLGYAD